MITSNATNPPAEEGVYGFGTTPAVEALIRQLGITADMTVLVAINVITLIRNAVGTKSVKPVDVVNKVRTQMNGIANDIASICQMKWPDKQHHILFYMANSDKAVPQSYIRPRTSPTMSIVDASIQYYTRVVKPGDQTVGNVTAHLRLASQMRVPSYKGLATVLSEIAPSKVELHLISHMPMDYHVAFFSGRKCHLYRSHTGEIVDMTPMNLARIVFKTDVVPFYPATHVLFGDKYLMKSTMDRETKKRVLTAASSEHWSMHSGMFVTNKIKDNRIVLPYTIS